MILWIEIFSYLMLYKKNSHILYLVPNSYLSMLGIFNVLTHLVEQCMESEYLHMGLWLCVFYHSMAINYYYTIYLLFRTLYFKLPFFLSIFPTYSFCVEIRRVTYNKKKYPIIIWLFHSSARMSCSKKLFDLNIKIACRTVCNISTRKT